jgi:hypothetical protein
MSNMKEVLVECASHVLARRYGPLSPSVCQQLLSSFDLKEFMASGDSKDIASAAATAKDFSPEQVLSRTFSLLRFVASQFWEEKKKTLLAASRLRTYLLRREVAKEFKDQIWETNERVRLDKGWKQEGVTFLESLPDLPTSNTAGSVQGEARKRSKQ